MLLAVTPQLEAALRCLGASKAAAASGASDALLEEVRESLAREYDIEEGQQPVRAISPSLLATVRPHLEAVMGIAGPQAARGGISGLLSGSRLVFLEKLAASEEEKGRVAKLEKRRRLLMLRSEEAEYQRITSNLRRGNRAPDRDVQASLKFQVGIAANLIVAALSMFVIGYWVSKYLGLTKDSHRMVVGLLCAVFIMLVEILIFVIRSMRADAVVRQSRQLTSNAGHMFGPAATREPAAGTAAGSGSSPFGAAELELPPR